MIASSFSSYFAYNYLESSPWVSRVLFNLASLLRNPTRTLLVIPSFGLEGKKILSKMDCLTPLVSRISIFLQNMIKLFLRSLREATQTSNQNSSTISYFWVVCSEIGFYQIFFAINFANFSWEFTTFWKEIILHFFARTIANLFQNL